MALGGGTFTHTNKTLPGAYINVVSSARSAGAVGERGVVAVAFPLSWNEQSAVIEVTAHDFYENCPKIFGYSVGDSAVTMFREVFKHASKIYVYNLNADGEKATASAYGSAKYAGVRGNQIKVKIKSTTRVDNGYQVETYFAGSLVDSQLVTSSGGNLVGLVANDYIDWVSTVKVPTSDVEVPFTGGSDGTLATDHTAAINALGRKSFNVMCAYTSEADEIAKYIDACKAARDELGVKYQCVVYNATGVNYEGVVNLANAVEVKTDVHAHGLLMWTAGALAHCPLHSSLTNFVYDGELVVKVEYDHEQLEAGLLAGKFMFHEVGSTVRVLDDINSYVGGVPEKARDIFASNQSIRIIDQTVNDMCAIFNDKYSGKIPNDQAGRLGLWSDYVSYYRELERIRVIDKFSPNTDLVVDAVAGNRRAVNINATITIINTMTQLYMTVLVK